MDWKNKNKMLSMIQRKVVLALSIVGHEDGVRSEYSKDSFTRYHLRSLKVENDTSIHQVGEESAIEKNVQMVAGREWR